MFLSSVYRQLAQTAFSCAPAASTMVYLSGERNALKVGMYVSSASVGPAKTTGSTLVASSTIGVGAS